MSSISAIIPTFNRLHYVQRAIDSIIQQTLSVDEIIVIDDGSTDGTADTLRAKYGSKIRVVVQPNRGVSAARRRGIEEAGGEWIAFLDSDDVWTPDRTRLLKAAIHSVPSAVAWIFGDCQAITDAGEDPSDFEKHQLRLRSSPHVFDDALVTQHPFQFTRLEGGLIRRSALLECDCFSLGLRTSEDVLVGFQLAAKYRFAAIDAIVTKFYRSSDLAGTSLNETQGRGEDYYRARIVAFRTVVESGRKRPWTAAYEDIIRGYCKFLARERRSVRKTALEQFRYGVSLKSVAFTTAALFGAPGVSALAAGARSLRKFRSTVPDHA